MSGKTLAAIAMSGLSIVCSAAGALLTYACANSIINDQPFFSDSFGNAAALCGIGVVGLYSFAVAGTTGMMAYREFRGLDAKNPTQ